VRGVEDVPGRDPDVLAFAAEVPLGEVVLVPGMGGEARDLADEEARNPDRDVLAPAVPVPVDLDPEGMDPPHGRSGPAEEAPQERDQDHDDDAGDDRASFLHSYKSYARDGKMFRPSAGRGSNVASLAKQVERPETARDPKRATRDWPPR